MTTEAPTVTKTRHEWRGVYQFKGFRVEVVYSNNVSVAEVIYAKRKFTEDEKKALVESIGGEGKWSKLALLDQWINTDTKASARVDRVAVGQDALLVASPGYVAADNARRARSKKDAARSTSDGF